MAQDVHRIQFVNYEQQDVTVHIYDTSASGDITYIDHVGTGLKRRTVDNSEDKYTPIRPFEWTIKFLSSNLGRADTFIGDPETWYVEILINSDIIFVGFLVTDDLEQPYFDDPNEITLITTDGLGTLKSIPLGSVTNINPRGYKTVIEFISMCLRKTNLAIDTYVMCNIHEEIAADLLLDNCYLESKTFEEEINISEDAYSALSKVLRSLGAFVQQRNEAWYITSVDEMEDSNNTYWRFDTDGVRVGTSITANYLQQIGSTETIKFSQEDQLLQFRSRNWFARLDYNFEYPIEIIDNINYDRGNFNGVVVPPAGYTAYHLDEWASQRNFPHSGTPLISPIILRKFVNDYETERFISIPAVNTGGNTEYIRSNAIPVILKDKFTFSFDFRFPSNLTGTGMVTDLIGYVYIQSGATVYSLSNDGKWNSGSGFTITHQWNRGTTDEREWMNVSVEADPVPISGNVYVCLLKSSLYGNTTDTYFSNISFEYIPYIDGVYKKITGQYNKWYLDLVVKPNFTDEVNISDSPKPLFKGALFIYDGSGYVLVSRFYNLWRTPTPTDPDDYYNFGKIQALGYWNQYNRAMRVFDGSMQGLNSSTGVPDCTWKYELTDANDNADNKIFMCVGFEQDFYSCEWKGTFIEVHDTVIGKTFDDDFLFKYIE